MSVSNFHQLWINLQCQKNKSIIICVTYRPPDTSLNCFEDLLKPNYVQALTLNKQILVLGDLNCNMLENGQERRALTNFSTELNLTQIIKTTFQTLIDVILVSSTALVLESGVINTSFSDHLPVYVLLKLKAPKMPACYILQLGVIKTIIPHYFPLTLSLNRIVCYPYYPTATLIRYSKPSEMFFTQLPTCMHR